MKKIGIWVFVIFVVFESCNGDDDAASPNPSPRGDYSFNGRSNIVIKKWIAGGLELLPVDSDFTNIEKEGAQLFNGFKFHFGRNNMLSFKDSVNNESDSIKYKIENNTVYVFIGPNSYTNTDYIPYFYIDGDIIYISYQEVWYSDFFGESGIGMPKFKNIYLVDTALKEMGYISLNQLKNQDRIVYSTFRENFKHED